MSRHQSFAFLFGSSSVPNWFHFCVSVRLLCSEFFFCVPSSCHCPYDRQPSAFHDRLLCSAIVNPSLSSSRRPCPSSSAVSVRDRQLYPSSTESVRHPVVVAVGSSWFTVRRLSFAINRSGGFRLNRGPTKGAANFCMSKKWAIPE